MGPRAGLDWRKISSPPGFVPGPSSPLSVSIPTELPGSNLIKYLKVFLTNVVGRVHLFRLVLLISSLPP